MIFEWPTPLLTLKSVAPHQMNDAGCLIIIEMVIVCIIRVFVVLDVTMTAILSRVLAYIGRNVNTLEERAL